MTSPSSPVNNNLGWGIAGLILFWPVGLFALIKAIKVGSLQASGDIAGAQEAADSAKKLGKIAVWVGVALYVVFCLFYVVVLGLLASNS